LLPKKKMRAHLPVCQDSGQHTKLAENHGSVGPQTYAGPGLPQLARFFENPDGETRLEQGNSGSNAADTPAYNTYRLARHSPVPLAYKVWAFQQCCNVTCFVAGHQAGKRAQKQLLAFEQLERLQFLSH
jgi:hypothetical protein